MASDLITCIGSAVDDLQFLVDSGVANLNSGIKLLMFKLRNIRTFLFSAKILSNDDPTLGSLLLAIEDFVCDIGKRFHTACLFLCGEATSEQFHTDFLEPDSEAGFGEDFTTWDEQISEFYVVILEDIQRQSFRLTADSVSSIMVSVLQNLEAFHSLEWEVNGEILGEPMKALEEQMKLLRNLASFVSRAVDSDACKDLCAHVEVISINAAFLLFRCDPEECDESICCEMLLSISVLIQRIMPVDPQVYKTYTEVLNSSKSGRRSLAPADRDVGEEEIYARQFLESLMSNVLEMPQLCAHAVSMLDQFQELYDGLGSLRTILSHQPNKFDLETKDHIFDLVCDAAVLIFTSHQTHVITDHELQHLLNAISRLIAAELREESATPESMFNIVPTTAPLSFVDFLLEKLEELTSCEAETNSRGYPQIIKDELVFLRSFIGDIAELRHEKEELQTLWDHTMELVYKVEHLIDYLVVCDLSDSFVASFDSIMKLFGSIKMEVEIWKSEITLQRLTMTHCPVPPQRTLSLDNDVVGFLDEAESITNRLTRGSKKLQIVAIVGMPGQGKTTLATKIYNNDSVACHFAVRARATVSQIFEKKRILLEILNQIDPNKCAGITSDNDLVQIVWRSLRGMRYLIFLDDIWEAEALSSLKEAFPDDHMASRIMLTSRHHDISTNAEPHMLRPFNEDESMDLLQRKLFGGSGWPIELVDLGIEITEICKGLPLTIVIVAGVLASTETKGWRTILGGLRSGTISSTEQCWNTLELSYKHLPEHLRPCLLYFAMFPEDEDVSVRKLISLWAAEGFIRKDETKRIEDVAENYLKDLIGRSLLMVAQQKSMRGAKTCRVHDLLHEFCLQKAKDEHFFSSLGENEFLEFQAPHNLRRLCINSDPKHLIRFSNFFPHARSLRFSYYLHRVPQNLSFLIHICKLLRVLDLGHVNLSPVFPSEIGDLVQLAFLAIQGHMREIPSLIGNLSNLETFILNRITGEKAISFPESFWNLRKLRHLYVTSPGGTFPMENLGSSSNLCGLGWLSGLAIPFRGNRMEGLMKKFPNVRKLKCILWDIDEKVGDYIKVAVPEFLSRLESLGMSLFYGIEEPQGIRFEFSLPANLKKLTLLRFHLSSESLLTIANLSNLEVLKLKAVSFENDTWKMQEEKFPKLRFLQLSSWKLHWWSASEDHFDCLERLVLTSCGFLKEMPSCLEEISTLEVIQVARCSATVVELVGRIKEVQEEHGNSELKIITS
ncbi:OLC1v1008898C1 [Oldenlandia corymbosa var. corymbosa]|uniref:OLC1v1008898C1 n=1 Tax=Oldenlandia corymbosa var. corymbosa TaxID=529605 RepID=A0AAV1DMM3_OLDCO|nr:OLC1v1008898C1 [Oldenlandia corymbosa var. corymbosa]